MSDYRPEAVLASQDKRDLVAAIDKAKAARERERLPGCICSFPSQRPEWHAKNCRHYREPEPVTIHDREGGEL